MTTTYGERPGMVEVATARFFVRCLDCLSVSAVECERLPRAMECGICGGALESMGKVSGRYLTHPHLGCPCDGRCTGARGPSCDCSCGGKNHGSNLLVEFVTVAGKVPAVMPALDRDKAMRVATVWRGERAAAREAIRASAAGDAAQRKAAGEYLGGERWADFMRYRRAMEIMAEARKAKSQTVRLRKLAEAVSAARGQS